MNGIKKWPHMITTINHLTLAVTDIEKSFKFYRDILKFNPLVKWDRGAYFLVGKVNGFWFCLNVDANRIPSPCYTHYAFSVDQENFAQISTRLINSDVRIFKGNTSPGDSLYFLDPDEHKIEIHVGNWHTRIKEKKINPGDWKNIEWYI